LERRKAGWSPSSSPGPAAILPAVPVAWHRMTIADLFIR
jgi:hypothetical protein